MDHEVKAEEEEDHGVYIHSTALAPVFALEESLHRINCIMLIILRCLLCMSL